MFSTNTDGTELRYPLTPHTNAQYAKCSARMPSFAVVNTPIKKSCCGSKLVSWCEPTVGMANRQTRRKQQTFMHKTVNNPKGIITNYKGQYKDSVMTWQTLWNSESQRGFRVTVYYEWWSLYICLMETVLEMKVQVFLLTGLFILFPLLS